MTTFASPQTYRPTLPIWCAGCGHYGVQSALQAALNRLEVPDHDVMILAGIGCSGTVQNNLGTYGYHAQHGRVLPAAAGLALANPSLTVVAAGGDGDGYAIGVGHLVHAFRRDVNFTYIVMNNETYGLTKGQHSPTQAFDYPSHEEAPFDAIAMGLSIGGTSFVARGYSGSYDQLVRLTTAALQHARHKQGFAFLEVISPCVTYRDSYPRWEHTLHDVDTDPSHDSTDRAAAMALTIEHQKRGELPIGLIYQAPFRARSELPDPAHSELNSAILTARYESIMDTYAVAVDPL